MQFQSSDWLSHHGIMSHYTCTMLSKYGNCTCLLKSKTSWKSVVFTNKVGKNSQYFCGCFYKAIIFNPLCLLLDMRMIIAYSVLRISLAICHRAVTKSRSPGIFLGYHECEPRQLSQETKGKQNQKNLLSVQSPSTYCIDPVNWNFSKSHVPSHIQLVYIHVW